MALPPVYLVDASVYIFRAWFSMPDEFVNQRGEPTNAVYGFSGFLCNLLEQTGAEHVAVAFDESLSQNYRNEIYPEYKANRDPAPEELKRQFSWARSVAEAMGLQCFADARYEADDLIGTLCEFWRDRGHPICIVTADKDLAQLVGENDHWWDFSRNQKLNARQLTEKFGVMPEQMADYLALTGDSVDNIPGVPGVGPKSASALLQHFGDLDTIYERLEEVQHLGVRGARSLQNKLSEHRETAELARQLTVIEKRVASALAAPELGRTEVDTARLNRLFDELSFGGMLRQRCLRA
ncbi:MAG: exodeoxyribonuclease IX [Xanthomonadales bacterium]|jgi:5'-3' exonuclease|nr:exodeoxyribonuclease IX [Xanthomonadales bacterium]MDH3925501.1 exodeoxyribonuclease IX [Xanthomonadales bacterium]MDH3942235.1 exodeoxyribonuclease IX [Xanthomonadales bacterium]MDH3999888.1 exodeoxyribonuclease IX [Xanthomonadales bacterium]